jgi:hypothetical protein
MADNKITLRPQDYLPGKDDINTAYDRFTRTPILFTTQDGDDTSGAYLNPIAALGQTPSKVPINLDQLATKGIMRINPYSMDNISTPETIRHEAVHSLLDKFTTDNREQIMNIPGHSEVANALVQSGRQVRPTYNEVPAYAGSNDPRIPTNLNQAYLKGLMDVISKANPSMAAILSHINQVGQ